MLMAACLSASARANEFSTLDLVASTSETLITAELLIDFSVSQGVQIDEEREKKCSDSPIDLSRRLTDQTRFESGNENPLTPPPTESNSFDGEFLMSPRVCLFLF